MPLQLRDLKAEARNLTRTGQFAAALAAHEQMLAKNPLDSESRRRIADLLFRLGDKAGAVEVYRAVAMHDVRWWTATFLEMIEGAGDAKEQVTGVAGHP